jgi:hypothetical protein
MFFFLKIDISEEFRFWMNFDNILDLIYWKYI